MKLIIHPLIPARWEDFETLFGANGACGGCWCMLWRLPRKAYDEGKGAGNRASLRALVDDGAVPGLIAYDGASPIGWCSVGPRSVYSALERSRVLKPVDEKPVWSVACLFIRKDYRKKGVSVSLLNAAADWAFAHGGTIIEGYPVEPKQGDIPPAFAWTGLPSAFQKAGFHEVSRRSPTRPVMRRER
jgi:GNAT superfamily N-acetyltransferase